MLINLDIRTVKEREEGWPADAAEERSCLDQTLTVCFGKRDTETEKKNTKVLKKKGREFRILCFFKNQKYSIFKFTSFQEILSSMN